MFSEHIVSEVIFGVAKNRVNVIRLILPVVILNDEAAAMNAIVVILAGLCAASPRKVEVVQPLLLDGVQLVLSDVITAWFMHQAVLPSASAKI